MPGKILLFKTTYFSKKLINILKNLNYQAYTTIKFIEFNTA